MNTSALARAYEELLQAADTVAASDEQPTAPPGEWNAEEILGHVVLLNDVTIAAACSTAPGLIATYDNRLTQDRWTIARVIALVGGSPGLRSRIQVQASALCALVASLTEEELDLRVPTLLTSNDQLLVHDHLPLRALVEGLVTTEIPAHAGQLLALLPSGGNRP